MVKYKGRRPDNTYRGAKYNAIRKEKFQSKRDLRKERWAIIMQGAW